MTNVHYDVVGEFALPSEGLRVSIFEAPSLVAFFELSGAERERLAKRNPLMAPDGLKMFPLLVNGAGMYAMSGKAGMSFATVPDSPPLVAMLHSSWAATGHWHGCVAPSHERVAGARAAPSCAHHRLHSAH